MQQKAPPFGGAGGQIVPVTIRVARPGVRVYSPVTGSRVKVAAGTVMTPGMVVKSPVVAKNPVEAKNPAVEIWI